MAIDSNDGIGLVGVELVDFLVQQHLALLVEDADVQAHVSLDKALS